MEFLVQKPKMNTIPIIQDVDEKLLDSRLLISSGLLHQVKFTTNFLEKYISGARQGVGVEGRGLGM